MTSEIAAPAAGVVDSAEGLLTDGEVTVPEEAGVVVCVCPDWPLPACEQAATGPATRKDTAIRPAIRIPQG